MDKKLDSSLKEHPYGWIKVGAAALLLFGAYGTMLSFGVFLKPLIDEFGWTRAETSGAMSVVMGVSGLFGILAGRLTDKYGARLPVTVGILVGGLSYWLMSQSGSLWQLYLYIGLGIGICTGSCYTPVNTIVSKWFTEKRALALGIALLGITLGQMSLSPLIANVIVTYGWRSAYLMMTAVVLITAVPAVIVLDRNPAGSKKVKQHNGSNGDNATIKAEETSRKQDWTAAEAVKTAPFWMLMITGFVLSAGSYFITAHIVAYATDIGISPTLAALVLTVMGIGGIAGTLLAWSMTVKLGDRVTFILLLASQTVALFLLIWATKFWLLSALILIFGFAFSAAVPVRTAMVARFFGGRSIGIIMGFASFAWSAGGMTGPVLAGYVFDLSQSYNIAFLAGGLLLFAGTLAVYFLKGRNPAMQPRN